MIDNICYLNLNIFHQQTKTTLTTNTFFTFQSLIRCDTDLAILSVNILESGFDETIAIVYFEYSVP